MKASLIFSAIALIALTACNSDSITGSGYITNEMRTTTAFQNIDIAGTVDVVITQGAKQSVHVETDDNLQSSITTNAYNKALKIRQDGGGYTRATVYITTPTLSSVTTQTTGTVTIASGFTTESFLLTTGSSGSVAVHNINAGSITAEVKGPGSVTISGITESFNCQHNGQGIVHAFDLVSAEAAVAVFNSGSVELTVTNKLFADILGSGNILYKGSPEVVATRKGSGTVAKQS